MADLFLREFERFGHYNDCRLGAGIPFPLHVELSRQQLQFAVGSGFSPLPTAPLLDDPAPESGGVNFSRVRPGLGPRDDLFLFEW